MDKSLILLEIEQCREEMISLGREHGLASNEVIQASKRLDGLLNDYQSSAFNKKHQTHDR